MSDAKNAGTFETFDASDYKVGIAVAKFNSIYTDAMLEKAKETLKEYKVLEQNITIVQVAGSMEIPVALQALALKGCDCLLAIGVIIKGETAHFDYVAGTVTDGALRVGLDHKVPIGFGVITAYNEEQARARVHIGKDAIVAALQATKEIKEIS